MTKPRHDYTIEQVAGILQCSIRTVQKMIAEGDLATYRLGKTGHRRITADELDRVRAKGAVNNKTQSEGK